MPLNLPSFSTIVSRIRSDISNLLPSLDPTIFGSWVRAFSDSNAGRHYDNTLLIGQLERQLFPQTALGVDLERWAEYEALTRFAATVASGNITFTGLAASTVPSGTELRSESGDLYTTQAAATISLTVISITSLTRSGSTVTAVTASDHIFASNIDVTISGANEADYNGTFAITVTDTNEFQYDIGTATPTSPATGTITATSDCATVEVESNEAGSDKNLSSGAILNLTSPIAGVDAVGYVRHLGVLGAQDSESDEDLLVRVLQSRKNPVANFNVAAIEKVARSIQGVTRVEVKRITPSIGDVTVLFMRDNDETQIPDSSEIAEVEAAIKDSLPATSDPANVIVKAPTPVSTDYTFTSISPDTSTMRAAIEENLSAFYEEQVDFETTITEDKYRSAIIGTIDPDTGDTLASFTLSTPSGDITITTDEIGVLGAVIF